MTSFLKDTLSSKKSLFLSATGMTILLKASTIAPPLLLGKIIDALTMEGNLETSRICYLLAVLCLAILLQSIFNPLQTYQLVKLVQETLREKSLQWTTSILHKDFEQFSSLRIGGLIKSLERGITAHEKLLTFAITSGFPLLIESTLIAGIFFYIGGATIFFALLTTSVAYMVLYRYLVNWRRPCIHSVNHQEDLVSSRIFETLQAGKAIKLEQAHRRALIPLAESYAGYAQAATRVASTGAILGSARILYLGLSTAGLLAWGVYDQLSLTPQLTIGNLVAVFSIAGLFLNNCSNLAEAYRALDQFVADKKSLQDLLALDDLIPTPQTPAQTGLSHLTLSPLPPITDLPLLFDPDQSVAIIGPSGAGKTTLLETLAGTLKGRRAHLAFNGEPLRPSDLEAYFNQVRYCPQNPMFLEGHFCQSVLLGHQASPLLSKAVDAFELADLVQNRAIAEGATNISGGEAKRLSLLRLLNRAGDFNLFDEPTASLDQETALRVWDVLFSHFCGKGLICATHDRMALSRFDRVIVVRQGAVIADGPWVDLQREIDIAEIWS